jgi:hypothetical protein
MRENLSPILRATVTAIFVLATWHVVAHAQNATAKEMIPDWMAWKVFQAHIAFQEREAVSKIAMAKPATPKRGLFSEPRLNSFELSMKRQFGLSPEKAASLVQSGQEYLAVLRKIESEARAESMRRYRNNLALRSKTVLELAKEDGLFAEVEQKKQVALAAHLHVLSSKFQTSEVAKLGQWVRDSVAPRIKIDNDAVRRPAQADKRQRTQSKQGAK